jgi:hypothetical protein
MCDFIFAALPWIALGTTVAVVVAYNSNKKKDKYQSNEKIDSTAKEKTGKENYATLWMLFGMAFGTAIGSSFIDTFGTTALTYGICFGMLIGALSGIFLKKK